MKTKYGEIKSLDDLFEEIKGTEKDENPMRENEHLAITTIEFKCKICGEIVKNYTDYSAIVDNRFYGKQQHLEFHKRLKEIGV